MIQLTSAVRTDPLENASHITHASHAPPCISCCASDSKGHTRATVASTENLHGPLHDTIRRRKLHVLRRRMVPRRPHMYASHQRYLQNMIHLFETGTHIREVPHPNNCGTSESPSIFTLRCKLLLEAREVSPLRKVVFQAVTPFGR